jgi:predicted nucleotidyltransferase
MPPKVTLSDMIPDDRHREILARMDTIGIEEGATILLAIESGSRAWGFPSPDSDFDVRFFYTRSARAYLGLQSPRDVIERPITDDVDLNGWDIRKALNLLLRGNAVAVEWLVSPIVYREAPGFRSALDELTARLVRRPLLAKHYFHLGRAAYSDLSEAEEVKLKRYLYAVRPALALLWLEEHRDRLPPMSLPELLAQTRIDADVAATLDELIEIKRATPELGLGKRYPVLDRFIQSSLARGETLMAGLASVVDDETRERAWNFSIDWTPNDHA